MRKIAIEHYRDGKVHYEFFLEPGESAPTGGDIAAGSKCVDISSGMVSLYSESISDWKDQFSLQD